KKNGVTYSNGAYHFPNGRLVEEHEDGSYAIQYDGSLHWEAYGGFLWLTFSDPQVRVDAQGNASLWWLSWRRDRNSGQLVHGGYIPVVTIEGEVERAANTVTLNNQPTYLTQEQANIFIYAYRKGLRMSNISFNGPAPEIK